MLVRRMLTALALSLAVVPTLCAQQIATAVDRSQALALFRTGQEFLGAEQFEKAIDAFTRAVQKDSLLSIAYYGIGQANMNLRRYAAAAKAYTDCIEATRVLHKLREAGNFEADKQRDDEIATLRSYQSRGWVGFTRPEALAMEEHLRDLVDRRHRTSEVFRPPAETLLALGSAHFRNGDRDAAEANWKAAVEVNPKYGEAHNNLAVIYMQSGRLAEADQELKLAEKNGFNVNPQFKTDLKERQRASKAQ
jgi:tetratricopeptide (TPR) repeat protein